MPQPEGTEAHNLATDEDTPTSLAKSASETTFVHSDDSGDAASTDATETESVESKLESSIVSLAEEFDFEVVGHGGDFNWAQGQRRQSIQFTKSHHDGIQSGIGHKDTLCNSPYDSCSSSSATPPSSPTIRKKSGDAAVPPVCEATVPNIPNCRIGDKDREIEKAIRLQRLAAEKRNRIDSVLEKFMEFLRASRKSITDCLNTGAWVPYPFALYTIHVCFVAITLGSFFLLVLPLYQSARNVSAPRDQQIVVDQDYPIPTGIFLSNADTRHTPAAYTLLEGWNHPDDAVYRFRISATDSDGTPRRQGLDCVSAVITVTPLSSDNDNENAKNMPILLRARGDVDGTYTFAVSDPGSGVGMVVVDIYAATCAHIEKPGLKRGAGVGHRIEGSPFVIRGKAANEKEHGKDPSTLDDKSKSEESPPKGEYTFDGFETAAWQYIERVIPRFKRRNLESQIYGHLNVISELLLNATARVRTGAQMLNNRVFDKVVAARENVETMAKGVIETLQELVGRGEFEKEKGARETKNSKKQTSKTERSLTTKIQKRLADLRDRVNDFYGNAKSGLEKVASKIPFLETRSPKDSYLKRAQNELRKLGSYVELKRKQITETTKTKGAALRENVEGSIRRGLAGMKSWAREPAWAVRRKTDRVVGTEKTEKESSWVNLRRAMSAFTGRQF